MPRLTVLTLFALLAACGSPKANIQEAPPFQAPQADAGSLSDVTRSPSGQTVLVDQSHDAAAPGPPLKDATIPLAWPDFHSPESDRYLTAGDSAVEAERWDEAKAAYAQAKAADPKHPGIGVARTRVLWAQSNIPASFGAAKGNQTLQTLAGELKKLTLQFPDYAAARAEYGRILLALGQAELAIPELKQAVKALSEHPEVRSALGVAYLATGRKLEALAEIQKAATLDPARATRHANAGAVLLMNEKVKEAINEFETATRIDKSDAKSFSDLGAAYLADGQLEKAVSALREALALDSKNPAFHTNLGFAYQRIGKKNDAIGEYREALRLDPNFASAMINLATALALDPKSRKEARTLLLRAKTIDASDPRVLANLSELDALEKSTK